MSGTINQFLDSIGQSSLTLTPDQEKALETLAWLDVNGPSRAGRTTTLALHHLKTARDNPGFPVKLVDHWDDGRRGVERMTRAIFDLLDRAPEEVKQSFVIRNGILRYATSGVRVPVDITYYVPSDMLSSTDSFQTPGLEFKPSPFLTYPGYDPSED